MARTPTHMVSRMDGGHRTRGCPGSRGENGPTIRAGEVDFDDGLEIAAALAREAAANTGNVSEPTRQPALAAGRSAGEPAKALTQLAANLLANYVNHFAYTEPGLPDAPELQSWTGNPTTAASAV